MPYFTGGDPIGPNQSAVTLDDFPSSSRAALGAAASEAWHGNASPLLFDTAALEKANNGTRLDRASAEQAVKQAGVQGIQIPDDGYTQAALDLLIQRKHDEARRQDILDRAPTGVVPSTMRFAAQLAAGIADPLNVAAAFVPGVGEERVAALLARAGDSFLARSVARAGIGAAQAGIGTAALEPIIYGAHQQLQDDYGMANVLTDLAFGAALGGVMHVGAGAVGDLLRGGEPHPAQRFTGLSVEDIRSVMTFERERAGMPIEDQARALQTFSPEARKALGVPGEVEAPVHTAPEDGNQQVFQPANTGEPFRPPTSAAEMVDRVSPEIRETAMRTAIADFAQGRKVEVEDLIRMDPANSPKNVGPLVDAMIADLQGKRAALLPTLGEDSPLMRVISERIDSLVKSRPLFDAPPSTLSDVHASAEQQAKPQAIAIGDFFAARTEENRLAKMPQEKDAAKTAADGIAEADASLKAMADNLEHGGFDRADIDAALATLKPYEDAVADSKNLGNAVRAAAICGLRT